MAFNNLNCYDGFHTVKISGTAAVFHIEQSIILELGNWFALTRGRTVDPVTAM